MNNTNLENRIEQNHTNILHQFKESLSKNKNLEGQKEAIEELFEDMLYNSVVQDFSLSFENLINRISTLKIKEGNRYLLPSNYRYDVVNNTIELKKEDLGKNDDYLFSVILYDLELHPNKEDNSYFSALYTGEIHDLAYFLTEGEIPFDYLDEVMLYRSLKAVLGAECIYTGLKTSDCASIYKAMQGSGFTNEDIKKISDTSNYNLLGRNNIGVSNLLDNQKRIIDVFVANASKNPAFAHQQIHFLKKSLLFPFSITNGIKYTLAGGELNTDYRNVLLDYFNKQSEIYGLENIELESTKEL